MFPARWLHRIALASALLLSPLLRAQNPSLLLNITDENGVAVPGAVADLMWHGSSTRVRCQSDYAGRCRFTAPPGAYRLVINKDGFYALTLPDVKLGQVSHVDARLTHVQEVRENVQVA